jgi:hypothetical protein
MERENFPLEIIVGIGLVIVATAVFLAASLMRTTGSVTPTPTPLPPIQPPTAAPTVPAAPTAIASPSPVPETTTPVPTAAVPQVAPDFTLQRADGGTFTLAEQLARGPVVLVFFQVGG